VTQLRIAEDTVIFFQLYIALASQGKVNHNQKKNVCFDSNEVCRWENDIKWILKQLNVMSTALFWDIAQ
jgi:Holliday junction resolvase RusA-like endonuclease